MNEGTPPPTSALVGIVRGAAVALAGSVLGGGLGFAFSVAMGRMLDPAEFGLFVLALNVVNAGAWFGVAGSDFAAIRFVAAAATPGAKRGAMVTPIAVALTVSTALAVAAAVLAGPVARDLLHEPDFAPVLRVLAFVLPATVAAQMLSAALSGLEHARGEFARKVAEQGGRIAFGMLAVALGLGVTGVVGGMALAAVVAVFAVGSLLRRALPRGGELRLLPAREVLAFAWPQTVAGVARRFWDLANIAILARYADTSTVGLLGAALAIGELPQVIYNSFAFRFSPTISRLWAAGERTALAELLHSVTRWVSVAAVPFFAVAIVLPGPLLEVYGDEYRGAATALALVAAGSLFNSLAGPVEWALIMTGRVRLEMATNVTSAALAVALAFVLTPRYGLTGAAVCVMFVSVFTNVVKMTLVYRVLGMHTLSSGLVRPLAAGSLAGLAALALQHATGLGHDLLGTGVLAFTLVGAYGALVLAGVGMSPDDLRSLKSALRRTP